MDIPKTVIRSALSTWHRRQQGQIIPIVALALLAMMGIVGLATDGGIVMYHRRELVRIADASALGAAAALTGPTSETDATKQARARQRATEYAVMNSFTPGTGGNVLTVDFPATAPARKLARVEASEDVALAFMQLFGFASVRISSGGRIGEAAPLDIVIVQDVSISQLTNTHCMDNKNVLIRPTWGGQREVCNTITYVDHSNASFRTDTVQDFHYIPTQATTAFPWYPTTAPRINVPWQPFAQQQWAARYFIDQLDSRYDQVAIVSFSTTVAGGIYSGGPARLHHALTNNFASAKATIGDSPQTVGQVGSNGLYPDGGTALGAGIRPGITALTTFPPARENAVGAMILLTDGSATNRTDGSRPGGCDSAHLGPCAPCRQDAMAQAQAAADRGIVVYTIFVGSPTWEVENALLMQYISDLTDNRRLEGNYQAGGRDLVGTGGPAFTSAELANVTENYFRAENQTELQAAYDAIFQKIYTRLVNN